VITLKNWNTGVANRGVAWVLTFFVITASALSLADELTLKTDVPLTYVVKKGDTLWDISGLYLEEPWRWPELWNSNPQIDNPHLIYPGDQLLLRWEDGVPQLVVGSRGDVKLTPKLRSERLETAIPPIPRDQIDAFIRENKVVLTGELEELPYVIAGDAGRIISALGDRIYARGPVSPEDKAFDIVRQGEVIVDPVSGEVLGVLASDIGSASISRANSADAEPTDVRELEITRVAEEVRIGDRLLPLEEGALEAYFQPRAPEVDVEGAYMIGVASGVTQIGQMNIVTVNRGDREGLAVGDVLAIYQTGQVVEDPVTKKMVALPDVRAGVLMLFAVYEKASFGLVLTASRPLAVGDKLKNP
jgi:nucleoid-associated protein YgaU